MTPEQQAKALELLQRAIEQGFDEGMFAGVYPPSAKENAAGKLDTDIRLFLSEVQA